MSPTYIIFSGSGKIGRQLVAQLLQRSPDIKVVLPTSNADRLKSTLKVEDSDNRIHVAQGDVQNASFVEQIAKEHGVTAAFVCFTGENELMLTLNTINALQRASVKHIVYLSASFRFGLDDIKDRGTFRHASAGHVVVKEAIEAKLRYGIPERGQPRGFTWTVLGPSLFFENDFLCKPSLLDATNPLYSHPIGSKGVSKVSTVDIALAAANALVDDGKVWHGKKVMIGSLKTYTNVDVAALWAAALGKDSVAHIKTDEDGLARFEKAVISFMGPLWTRDMRLMFEQFEEEGFGITKEEYEEQVQLLGREASSYEKFVKDTAEEWKSEV